MQTKDLDEQVSMFGPGLPCGKMCRGAGAVRRTASPARISGRSLRRSSGLKNRTLMLLDLRPDAGNMLGPYWEYDPAWLGQSGRLNTSACPKGAIESSLSQILQGTVPSKYYLSRTACRGILQRAKERGKPLPPQLELALKLQARIIRPPPGVPVADLMRMAMDEPDAAHLLTVFCTHQRDAVRELPDRFDADGSNGRNPGSLVYAAGFSAGAGSSARSLGYQEEMSPTLKAGNNDTSVLCLNDQGGQRMDCTDNYTATLRAQSGHPPLVCLNARSDGAKEPECQPIALYENHGIDARYKGPLPLAPALSARMGTGGNNASLVLGKPAIFARQRVDVFRESEVVSTESARQHKDATDLIFQPDDDSSDIQLIRRLVPRECELLQGYPPSWTELPGASDSARYKALGNSVAIPCVEYLMQGIALVLRAEYRIKTSPGT